MKDVPCPCCAVPVSHGGVPDVPLSLCPPAHLSCCPGLSQPLPRALTAPAQPCSLPVCPQPFGPCRAAGSLWLGRSLSDPHHRDELWHLPPNPPCSLISLILHPCHNPWHCCTLTADKNHVWSAEDKTMHICKTSHFCQLFGKRPPWQGTILPQVFPFLTATCLKLKTQLQLPFALPAALF